jgi:hypothetical protein
MSTQIIISRIDALPALAGSAQGRSSYRLEDGQHVHVDAGSAAPGVNKAVLDAAAVHRVPLWIQRDASSGATAFVGVPLIARPVKSTSLADGSLDVELMPSHKVHILRHDHSRFDELRKIIETSMNATDLAVLEDGDQIRDLAPAGPHRAALGTSSAGAGPQLAVIPTALPRADIDNLFALVAQRTCSPAAAADPCIPFLYPDDGCWARAHEMCRLLNSDRFVAQKTWIYGNLRVATTNNPNCVVTWGWHVAPIVLEKGTNQVYVIDPSISPAPLKLADWESTQTVAAHVSAQSGPEAYYRGRDGAVQVDPEYTNAQTVLAFYRLKLQERALTSGSPPYPQCAG